MTTAAPVASTTALTSTGRSTGAVTTSSGPRALRALEQLDVDLIARPLVQHAAQLGRDRELVRAVAECHERALERALDDRISTHYEAADPAGIVASAPGVGAVLAPMILGRLGDAKRFRDLAAVRNYTGLVPRSASPGPSTGTTG